MPMFRYPGGKSRLMAPIAAQLSSLPMTVFHDVFVGGGSVLTYVAENYPKAQLFANDLDPNISAFWQVVGIGTESETAELIALLERVPTIEWFNELRTNLSSMNSTRVERAYRAVFFNRTTFSGISTAGAIGGVNQTSKWTVDCRYNAKVLVHELQKLRKLLYGRLAVAECDALDYLKLLAKLPTQTCYLDPPYYVQGKALYAHFMAHKQHVALAEALKHRTNWVLSYDNCEVIKELYSWTNKTHLDARYSVNGVKTDWTESKECLFYSNKDAAPAKAGTKTLPTQAELPYI